MKIAEVQERARPIFEQYGVTKAAVFGSIARGEATPESDVDLVVSFKSPLGLFKFFEFSEMLEAVLGRSVDVSTHRSLNARLAARITPDLISVYEG